MNPASLPTPLRFVLAILLMAVLLGTPVIATKASSVKGEDGRRLLQVEFPDHVSLQNADCEQLAGAVGRATLAHQPEATAILRAALTRGARKLSRGEGKLPCACAKHLLAVSVAAAPTRASALLDLATELYPTCADELVNALRDYDRVAYDYKDGVNDKNVVDDRNGPARGKSNDSGDPNTVGRSENDPSGVADSPRGIQDPSDLSERDITGLGYSDAYSFGSAFNGFGPGFPGAPGFVGSTPSGGIGLPPVSVTSVVNG